MSDGSCQLLSKNVFLFLTFRRRKLSPPFSCVTPRHGFIFLFFFFFQVLDSKEVVNKKRPDGSAVKIAECNVGDASGTIMFTARNKQGASPSGTRECYPHTSLRPPSRLPARHSACRAVRETVIK